ncbi:Cobalt/magnesium transport protein CorA [bioreactor metagenome]|jgi:magnesium transporter|uniref:Cobalt/magnesium transport protein CorA n=1 Tax=bioreactor metagenome TaxID=1076179 RepID=A0A644VHC5_9ZZZZ|nr:magnesium transporter CorA family protein [Bacteroidales bacterium]
MIETINFENVKWLHILNPSEDDFDFLLKEYEFHPLDIEDCRSVNQRPKIDEYDDYYFLILHFPFFDKANKFVRVKEVKIFWGKDYIVTIGRSHWVVKNLFKDLQKKHELGSEELSDIVQSSDSLLYNILDRLMVETYTLILRIGTEVDGINYDIFSKKSEKVIEQLSITRKNIISLNTTFKPQVRVFHKFESGGIKGYEEDMEDYWGNILDQYQKMFDLVEDYGELIEGLSHTFDSLQTNKTNEIMRILTFISTIMLPLSVISGIYGMNVNLPFMQEGWVFGVIIAVMLIVVVGFIFYFKKKRWL